MMPLVNYVRRTFGSSIGEITAEKLRKNFLLPLTLPKAKRNLEMEAQGNNLAEGAPRTCILNTTMFRSNSTTA